MPITATTNRLVARSRNTTATVIRQLDREFTGSWATSWDDLTPRITAALESLIKDDAITWPRPSEITRNPRLVRMLNDINRATVKLVESADEEITKASRDVALRAASDQDEIISSQLPAAWRPMLMESAASERRLQTAINRTSRRVTTLTRAIPSRVERAVRRALSRGTPDFSRTQTAVRAMTEAIKGAFGVGLTRTLTISSTEIMDLRRTAIGAAMASRSDVVTGWIWLARLDRLTCSACMAMHGTEHSLDESGPDGHPRCRCEKTPKAKTWQELGFNLGLDDPFEPEDLVQDAREFFDGLPEADQRRIMGPTKLNLLKQGLIKWSDLATFRENPRWRGSYVPTPVSQLRR